MGAKAAPARPNRISGSMGDASEALYARVATLAPAHLAGAVTARLCAEVTSPPCEHSGQESADNARNNTGCCSKRRKDAETLFKTYSAVPL